MQRVFDCLDPTAREGPVSTAITKIKRGRVGVVPDESMYLLLADAFSLTGVTRVRYIKGQEDAPLTVLVGHHSTVDGVAGGIAPWARDLMQAFWPGPLTVLLRQQPSLSWPLTARAVGVRMPLHPIALAVVRSVGPTASTSVNRLGLPPARDCDDAFDQFDRDVDIYLDAGPCATNHRSTVVDATGDHPVIRRAGAVTNEQIESVVGELEISPSP